MIGAKSSIDVTYIPKAEATGRVHVRTQCMARAITVDHRGRARSVVYFDAERREREVFSRAVVVAGNAVETPRLLLLSTSNRFPEGLANSSGLVGRFFMEHLPVFASGVFEDRVDPWRGVPTGGLIQDYYETRPAHDFARGWSIVVTNSQQWPVALSGFVGGWGRPHKRSMKELFGHLVQIASIGEQLPNEANQVTLDPAVEDLYGLPVPRIRSAPRDNDVAMTKRISAVLHDLLDAAGARQIDVRPPKIGNSSHYMGTCRMGADPQRSVVNPWCRTHDVPNLFIGDGSVFVTGGAANPALTISALATRTAIGIIAAFERGDL
jgi:choline dehydrogenase-like flavoprotein